MNVSEAIRTRRSVGTVKDEAVPREQIERILEAGTWAPTHRKTEPWRFFVLQGEGRARLAAAMADTEAAEKGIDPSPEEREELLASALKKVSRAPVIIAVGCEPASGPKIIPLEETLAVGSAIQNMLLEAHALGLGAVWRSGSPCYHPLMAERFGLGPDGQMLGFIYLGYPDREPGDGKREPVSAKTVWIDGAEA
ncbi:nitroreductase family protein [Saccharibacillus alkalitolerans]|uniref:Putative NAD(P)H nitroreductase n=1 Tax=Saccharibacillus alkalitolerans TaxID=2705290 RepID=A0ABX0FCQ2_9BACL|nr:nitroreductase [Saccharibacillus alkalitolerans]NGZ78163.1 nitroreductase [Saccharibacillus alkalitolerans]